MYPESEYLERYGLLSKCSIWAYLGLRCCPSQIAVQGSVFTRWESNFGIIAKRPNIYLKVVLKKYVYL